MNLAPKKRARMISGRALYAPRMGLCLFRLLGPLRPLAPAAGAAAAGPRGSRRDIGGLCLRDLVGLTRDGLLGRASGALAADLRVRFFVCLAGFAGAAFLG